MNKENPENLPTNSEIAVIPYALGLEQINWIIQNLFEAKDLLKHGSMGFIGENIKGKSKSDKERRVIHNLERAIQILMASSEAWMNVTYDQTQDKSIFKWGPRNRELSSS